MPTEPVSSPEDEVREIAERLVTVAHEPRGGDSPYGWSSDAYEVLVGACNIGCYRDKRGAESRARGLRDEIANGLIEAQRLATERAAAIARNYGDEWIASVIEGRNRPTPPAEHGEK